ncbi:MAG: hypothetical protein NC191_03410 [Muribaculaceae bacterium]|nr:hypothetical protein [Muribaculaceae bacterium]
MAPKVNVLYPFDKGFFGGTLMKASSSSNIRPGKAAMLDSVSDFTKHFEDLITKQFQLEKAPKADKFERCVNRGTCFADIYPGAIS